MPYGSWIIREVENPKGFVLSEEEIPVTIGKVDEVVEIELVNEFITGNIELTKVDKDYPDNKLTGAVLKSLPIPTKMASTTRKMSCLAKCLSLAAASTR